MPAMIQIDTPHFALHGCAYPVDSVGSLVTPKSQIQALSAPVISYPLARDLLNMI